MSDCILIDSAISNNYTKCHTCQSSCLCFFSYLMKCPKIVVPINTLLFKRHCFCNHNCYELIKISEKKKHRAEASLLKFNEITCLKNLDYCS